MSMAIDTSAAIARFQNKNGVPTFIGTPYFRLLVAEA